MIFLRGFFFIAVFWVGPLWAFDLGVSPRYDLIADEEEVFSNRFLVNTNLSWVFKNYKLYYEAFAEHEAAKENQVDWRRVGGSRIYLQELYFELQFESSYFKVGTQALRWSESWVTPSLDIWTGRRYNRLFVDPLAEQLTHPLGVSYSYARKKWSLDWALMLEKGKDFYPMPYDENIEINNPDPVSTGVRVRWDMFGFQSNVIVARVDRKNTFGYGSSYAFNRFVAKTEIGFTFNDHEDNLIQNREMYFGSLGADIFWGNLLVTPQLTLYQGDDVYIENPKTKYLWYLFASWNYRSHGFEFQTFNNQSDENYFISLLYNYNFWDLWKLSIYTQNYEGIGFSLPALVKQNTGGTLAGIRLQYNGSWSF